MKKSFKLWLAISNVYYKVIQVVLTVALVIIAQIFVVPVIEEKIGSVKTISSNQLKGLVIIVFGIAFTSALMKGIYRTILENKELEYILVLRKIEYFYYVLLQKSSWYYMYMVVIVSISGSVTYKKILLMFLCTALYLAIVYVAYIVNYKKIYIGKDIAFVKKRIGVRKNSAEVVNKKAYKELILLGIKERYTFLSMSLCKIAVIFIAIIIGKQGLQKHIILIIYCFLAWVLILSNDVYWKNEKQKIKLFCGIGVLHKRYIGINWISGVIFNLVLLDILVLVFSKSIIVGIIFACVGVFQQLYWDVVYLYVNLRLSDDKEVLEIVLYVFFILIDLFPILNVFVLNCLLRKISVCWQGEMEC